VFYGDISYKWALNKMSGFLTKREQRLLDTVKAKKLAYVLWSHHEETRKLPGERDNAGNNARCTQARKATHGLWMDNFKAWTGLPVEESLRMTEDRDKWRKYVHGRPTL